MTRKLLLVLLVLTLGLAVVGCDAAGAGGDDADTSQDGTTDDGTTDDGTGDDGTGDDVSELDTARVRLTNSHGGGQFYDAVRLRPIYSVNEGVTWNNVAAGQTTDWTTIEFDESVNYDYSVQYNNGSGWTTFFLDGINIAADSDCTVSIVGGGPMEPVAQPDVSCAGTTGDGTSGNVPSDVPSDSTAAVDGSGYGYLALDYFGGSAGGPYNTDVYLAPDSSLLPPQFYLELFDQTATPAIDAGTYTLNTTGSPSAGDITWIDIIGAVSGTNASYAASSEGTKSEFESEWGVSVDVYDKIESGTVTISVSDSVYTFSWSFSTADGDTLQGSYSGAVDETNE